MDNLEAVVISSRSISHPHDPYEGVVSFLINEFAEGEQPWQVQQFSNGELVDSDYFNTEAEAEAWVAREATLTAAVARHDLEQARDALEAAEYWLAEEAASPHPGQTRPDDILRTVRDALGKPHDATDAAPSAPQTPAPDASALMLAALHPLVNAARAGIHSGPVFMAAVEAAERAIRAAEGREG